MRLHQIRGFRRGTHQILPQREHHRRYASHAASLPTRVALVVREREVRHDHGIAGREALQRERAQLLLVQVDRAQIVDDLPVTPHTHAHSAGDGAHGGLRVHARRVATQHLGDEEHQLAAVLLHLLHERVPLAQRRGRRLVLR